MASGNAILEALRGALVAIPTPDPTGGGTIKLTSTFNVVRCTDTSDLQPRAVGDAPAGTVLFIVNTAGGQIVFADSVPNTLVTLEDNEVGFLVSTGDAAYPWVATVLKTNAS